MMNAFQKAVALLSRRERRRAGLLLAMIMVMALIDAAGVFSIMPFLAVLARPDIIESNRWLARAYEGLGFPTRREFLLFLGLAVFLLLVFGNLFRMLTTWAQLRFTHMRGHALAVRLLANYLARPYAFFLNRNSAELSKNILSETIQVNTIFNLGMEMIARLAVVSLLFGLLVAVDPMLAVIAASALGGAYYLIFRLVKVRLSVGGRDRVRANQERFAVAGEALGGIKDVKLMGLEGEFTRRFDFPSRRFARHQAYSQIVAQVPRFALETLAFGGIALAALFLVGRETTLDQALPVLGLYTFAGYRLLPAVQHIFFALASIRFNLPALDCVHDELLNQAREGGVVWPAQRPQALRLGRALTLENVSFRYPEAASDVLQDVSLAINAKSIVGIVGSTGSGKTTLIDLVLGLLSPTRGCLLVDGIPLHGERVRAWQQCLGYVPQHIYLADDSVASNIAFGVPRESVDMELVIRAGTLAGLHNFVQKSLPAGYDTLVGERGVRLSGGQRQRIGIARALYRDPDVLVMDEATSALDNATESLVMQAIRNLGRTKTLVIVAHRLTTVRTCDVIRVLEKGRIRASGGYEELLRGDPWFRRMAQATPESDWGERHAEGVG